MKNIIVTADWHLRDTKPKCRPKDEDWISLQTRSLYYLYSVATGNNADVFICGDIFHYSVVSTYLLNILLDIFFAHPTVKTYIIPGQHDLQYHSLEEMFLTSYGVLHKIAEKGYTNLRCIQDVAMAAPFGKDTFTGLEKSNLYFTHRLCMKEKNNWISGGITNSISAQELLGTYPEANIIFAGDNHNHFLYMAEDRRRVIVPGCLTRQSYDMKDYIPGFYLLKFEDVRTYEFIENIYDKAELVQDNQTEKKEIHDENMSSFVERLKGVSLKTFSLSFLDVLREAIEKDTLENECVSFIQEMIEKVKR